MFEWGIRFAPCVIQHRHTLDGPFVDIFLYTLDGFLGHPFINSYVTLQRLLALAVKGFVFNDRASSYDCKGWRWRLFISFFFNATGALQILLQPHQSPGSFTFFSKPWKCLDLLLNWTRSYCESPFYFNSSLDRS